MEQKATNSVLSVEIYGQTYNVKAGKDPAYIQKLAEHVNECMHQIAETTKTVDSLKVAILAALNITADYFQVKEDAQKEQEFIEKKSKDLLALLDDGVAGQ